LRQMRWNDWTRVIRSVCAGAMMLTWALAQETAERGEPATAVVSIPSAELESGFASALKNAQFIGRWCLVRDGELTPEKEERYTIHSATKIAGETWLISARIEFGDKDVTVPVPVKVKWAGDTPVITLTEIAIPGVGTYSARVLIYNDSYAGTWSGPGHAGLLSGMIVRRGEDGKADSAE